MTVKTLPSIEVQCHYLPCAQFEEHEISFICSRNEDNTAAVLDRVHRVDQGDSI